MKKIRTLLNFALIFSITVSLILMSGCGTKKSNEANNQNNPSSSRQGFSAENMKKMLDENLASLVQDGIITSEQEDKVIAAITDSLSKRMASITGVPREGQWNGENRPSLGANVTPGARPWGQGGSNGNATGGNNGNAGGNTDGNASNGNSNSNGNGGTNGNSNGTENGSLRGGSAMYENTLKDLVSDKTITQEQADAIIEKLSSGFGGFGGMRGNRGNNGTNGNANSTIVP